MQRRIEVGTNLKSGVAPLGRNSKKKIFTEKIFTEKFDRIS